MNITEDKINYYIDILKFGFVSIDKIEYFISFNEKCDYLEADKIREDIIEILKSKEIFLECPKCNLKTLFRQDVMDYCEYTYHCLNRNCNYAVAYNDEPDLMIDEPLW